MFNKRDQHEGESFELFHTELRSLIRSCGQSINQSTVLFHHTNIKIKAQTYTVTNIITATPVKVKQKSNIYIVIIETFQEQEQTRKQSLLGGLHQFNIESKNEREQTRNCSN
jgi:hypothetical protein